MRGIYKWTNLINGKKYIGKAEDVARRKRGYKDELKKGSDRYIIKALRKYGFENFSFEVIEKVAEGDNILEREQYWMNYYNSQDKHFGYNILNANETPGEKYSIGSKNNKARLNEEMVREIRTSIFIDEQAPKDVYQTYKNVISWDAFCKAYRGETWKNVDTTMIVDLTSRIKRRGVKKAKLTKEDVLSIRSRYDSGESVTEIFKSYSEVCNRNTIKRVVERITWKDV